MARISLTRSIKFRRLVARLGIPEPHVRGHLDYMWESCWDSISPVLGTPDVVELVAMWSGKPGEFSVALEDIGFLERDTDNRLCVHDFWDHAPEYVRLRADRRESKRDTLYNRGRAEKAHRPWRKAPPPDTIRPDTPQENDLSTNVGGNQHLPGNGNADRSPDESTIPGNTTTPRRHINPPGETDILVDYATEVLNKLEGVTTQTERGDRGTLLKIARHAPGSIVKRALADTQDARQRAELRDAGKYFTTRVTALCLGAGIMSPFAKRAEVSSQNREEPASSRASLTIATGDRS